MSMKQCLEKSDFSLIEYDFSLILLFSIFFQYSDSDLIVLIRKNSLINCFFASGMHFTLVWFDNHNALKCVAESRPGGMSVHAMVGRSGQKKSTEERHKNVWRLVSPV